MSKHKRRARDPVLREIQLVYGILFKHIGFVAMRTLNQQPVEHYFLKYVAQM